MVEEEKQHIKYNKLCDLVVLGNIANTGTEILLKEKKKELQKVFAPFYLDFAKKNIDKDREYLQLIYHICSIKLNDKKNIAGVVTRNLKSEIIRYVDKRNKQNSQIPNHEYIDRKREYAIFNINKGGILTTLHIITESMNCGLRYDMSLVPIRQETIEICDYFKINAYRLMTNEVYIFCVENYFNFKSTLFDLLDRKIGHRKDIVKIKEFIDNYMVCIGELNNSNDKIRTDVETESFLEKSYQDELEKVEGIQC